MILRGAVLLAALALVSGCFGKATYRWKEEVLLHDGRVIVIERSVRTGEVPVEIGQPPGASDHTLTFTAPGRRSVTWDGGKDFHPLIVDFHAGTAYVAAIASTGEVYERLGCPRPAYFLFRLDQSGWKAISFQDFPKEIRRSNLSSSPTSRDQLKVVRTGHVKLDDVRKSHVGLRKFHKELREDKPVPGTCLARGMK